MGRKVILSEDGKVVKIESGISPRNRYFPSQVRFGPKDFEVGECYFLRLRSQGDETNCVVGEVLDTEHHRNGRIVLRLGVYEPGKNGEPRRRTRDYFYSRILGVSIIKV